MYSSTRPVKDHTRHTILYMDVYISAILSVVRVILLQHPGTLSGFPTLCRLQVVCKNFELQLRLT